MRSEPQRPQEPQKRGSSEVGVNEATRERSERERLVERLLCVKSRTRN